jgi:RNA polymerase sigma-70 factor (ECF subfamily)
MRDIVRRVLDGDTEAFRAIVEEYGPCVRAYLAAHLNDPHAVDDLAQETFIVVFESLDRFRLDDDLGGWIRGIARNKLLMHWRRDAQKRNAAEQLRVEIVEDVAESFLRAVTRDTSDTIRRLQACLKKLPSRIETVIRARYFDREKVQDIARRLNTSPSAISTLLYRGRKDLQSCLGRTE